MSSSPQWSEGRFRNPQPLWSDLRASLRNALGPAPDSVPSAPVPVAPLSRGRLLEPAPSGLRAVWMGHSTVLLDLEGTRILTDPIWSRRASPVPGMGPRRFFEAPIALEDLPEPDLVVISHNHYDHLDRATVRRMRPWRSRFVVPLGLGETLARWGIDRARITELDWWDRTSVAGVEIVATPARHASGRGLLDRDRTLWAGFALLGRTRRVYFSGDTGFFDGLDDIGRLGPFDLTLIECGEYNPAWPDWHMGPEQAVEAHRRVGGRALLPIHWGTFKLAPHVWTEPMERVLAAAQGAKVLAPRPGEPVEPDRAGPVVRWWPSLPWKGADEVPIRATDRGLGRPLLQPSS